jgi:uncharacterized sporulation protein YeaH/YhbH (DUF444 family)
VVSAGTQVVLTTAPASFGASNAIKRENPMTVRIIDRRFDSKNKSSVNRSGSCAASSTRSARRCPMQFRPRMRDLDNGEKRRHSRQGHRPSRISRMAGRRLGNGNPGNDRFSQRRSGRSPAGRRAGAGKGKASNEGEGLDDFVFTLTRDEFLDIFFDDLALPNLVKNQLARIEEYKRQCAPASPMTAYRPTSIVVRSPCAARRPALAIGGPYRAAAGAAAELDELLRNAARRRP